jgi:hypothetical protein
MARMALLVIAGVALALGSPRPATAMTVLDNYTVFSENDLSITSNVITGNIYAGNSANFGGNSILVGHADYVHNCNGCPAGSSQRSTLGALDSNATILARPELPGAILISGNFTFDNRVAAGIYHVTGDVTFSAGTRGRWTIIADGDINVGGGGDVGITSFIGPSANFFNGLALYSADHDVEVNANGNSFSGAGIFGAVAGSRVILDSGSIVSGDVTPQVAEPPSLVLLCSGMVVLAAAIYFSHPRKNYIAGR